MKHTRQQKERGAFKEILGHITINAIMYRKMHPEEIFAEIKDPTYPHKVWRGCICLIGGSWAGQSGTPDHNPLETCFREVQEELSLEKRLMSTAELGEITAHLNPIHYVVHGVDRLITPEDEANLQHIKDAIMQSARPFDDYLITIPGEVFLRGDPKSKQTTITILACVMEVPLDEKTWEILSRLQNDFENLSCESESRLFSIDQMIADNISTAWGQDQILQEFFETKSVLNERTLPIDSMVSVQRAPFHPRPSYHDYLQKYTIRNIANKWSKS